MALLKRDIDSITGLRELLDQLETQLGKLNDGGFSEEDRAALSDLLGQLNGDLTYLLTDLHLSDKVYDSGDDEKVATVKAIREYVLGALQATGPQLSLERLTVNDGVIHLSHAPVNGREGLLNFARCLHINEDGHETLYRLNAQEDVFGFALTQAPASLNGDVVEVQYFHYHDPRDLNELIGQLILDGLVLVTPPVSE